MYMATASGDGDFLKLDFGSCILLNSRDSMC